MYTYVKSTDTQIWGICETLLQNKEVAHHFSCTSWSPVHGVVIGKCIKRNCHQNLPDTFLIIKTLTTSMAICANERWWICQSCMYTFYNLTLFLLCHFMIKTQNWQKWCAVSTHAEQHGGTIDRQVFCWELFFLNIFT